METKPPKPKKYSRHGKLLGRPTKRLVKLDTVPTRCPISLHQYLKAIHPFSHASLLDFHTEILNSFITKRPWEHGLVWRKPKSIMTKSAGFSITTGWRQVNIQMDTEMFAKVSNLSLELGVTKACFLYTALYWYAQYEKPPKSVNLLNRSE